MRAKRPLAASLKQGWEVRFSVMMPISSLHIAVTHRRRVLRDADQRTDDPIEQLLCPPITDVQQAGAVHPVVDRETRANQWNLQPPRQPVALATADGQIERPPQSVGFDVGEIHAVERHDVAGQLGLYGGDVPDQ